MLNAARASLRRLPVTTLCLFSFASFVVEGLLAADARGQLLTFSPDAWELDEVWDEEQTVDLAPDLPGIPSSGFPELGSDALVSDLPSPQPVGTTITFSLRQDLRLEGAEHRLVVAPLTADPRIVHDFTERTELTWTPMQEGLHLVTLHVRTPDRTTTTEHSLLFAVEGLGDVPVARATAHPLVALYSAPRAPVETDAALSPCLWPVGSCVMRVVFQALDSSVPHATSTRPLGILGGNAFLIAGMRAETTYRMRHEILDGSGVLAAGPVVSFTTGALPIELPAAHVDLEAGSPSDERFGVVLATGLGALAPTPAAYDMRGRPIWYLEAPGAIPLRPRGDGEFLLWPFGPDPQDAPLRIVDLAGNTVRSTQLGRLNEQLTARGEDPILWLHHEDTPLPGGRTAVLGSALRILEDVQGPGTDAILGDVILVLDADLQLEWSWSAFEHLDVTRGAVLGEQCTGPPACPPLPEGVELAHDWTHANAIDYSPRDGSLILSVRHLDEVVKIDYADGEGDGDVIWRLGREGDFTLEATGPFPWFSHPHDPSWLSDGRLVIFDNGNTRCAELQDCESRGQVYRIDEERMTAELLVDTRLGAYAFAVGSAQGLAELGYAFGAGIVPLPGGVVGSRAVDVDGAGEPTFQLTLEAPSYRFFRLRDLYSRPPWPGAAPDLPAPERLH